MPIKAKNRQNQLRIMSKKIYISTIILSALLLLPLVFFPISLDLSIFATAGKVIADGGKIYVDYVDVKPPLVYYLFAMVYKIFSWETFYLRLTDYIWQMATIISIIFVSKRIFSGKYTPAISAIIYAISFVSMNFENVTQCEGFIALPIVWSIYLFVEKQQFSKYHYLNGALAGIITGMKYSFGIILIPFALFDILNTKNYKELFKTIERQAIGFLMAFSLVSLPFIDVDVRHGFSNLMQYLSFYADNPPLTSSFAIYSLKVIGGFFGTKYSLLLTIAAFFSIYSIIKNNSKEETGINYSIQAKEKRFLLISLLIILFFLLSVFLERKYYFYHYLRFYLPLTLLSATGIEFAIKEIFSDKRKKHINIIITSGLLAFALFFGPFARYFNYSLAPYYYFNDKEKYHRIFDRPYLIGEIINEQRQVADYLKRNVKPSEKVLVMSIESNPLYQMADIKRVSKFALSSMYFGAGAPEDWKKDIFTELKSSDWLVIQVKLRQSTFNGHNRTAMESLVSRKEMYAYFLENFEVCDSKTSLHIFKRKIKN